MNIAACLSPTVPGTKNACHTTPMVLFQVLNDHFHFEMDVAASDDNALCNDYLTEEDDALVKEWARVNFCNPPYGRGLGRWVAKAAYEAMYGKTTVMLIPSRTDTAWFHDYIYQKPDVEVQFIKGRLKFGDAKNGAPFPSMIVIFRGQTGAKGAST